MLLDWAESKIREHTDRLFTKPPVTETRAVYFYGTRSRRLDDPLTNVTEIVAPTNHTVDGEPYPIVRELTVEEYEVISRPTGTTLRLTFPGDGRFDVTGTWGWTDVPGTIEMAVITTADEWYRSNVLPTTGGREEGATESRNLALPREVQENLSEWVLREMVA